jgi:hypothetical protein
VFSREKPERKAGVYVERTNTPKTRPEERRSMSAFPGSHVDLLDRPLPAVLTTEMPDGRFQSTVVWFNRDGGHILLNTMREFQKARNLRARPRRRVRKCVHAACRYSCRRPPSRS